MSRKTTESLRRAAIAGAAILLSQAALAEHGQDASRAPEQLTVTQPGDWMAYDAPAMEVDMSPLIDALIEALNRNLEQELEKHLEAIRPTPIELAVSEVPTRG
jgi:hypothetical protein